MSVFDTTWVNRESEVGLQQVNVALTGFGGEIWGLVEARS